VRILRYSPVVLIVLVAWATPLNQPAVSACGPFISFPVFTPVGAPADERYFDGELGILQPTYARRYLLVAWRTLQDRPLTSVERRAFFPSARRTPEATELWRTVRRTIPVQWEDRVSNTAWVSNTYSYYVNCGDSAFITAAKTLESRRPASGAPDADLAAWVQAQDVVFSNCSRRSEQPARVPEPLGPDASPSARAERSYQIAAAQFYGGRFADAEAGFNAIAGDPSSPWRMWGRYLAARAAIRQATLLAEDAEHARPSLQRAESILQEVLRDPALRERHGAARQLLEFVTARTRPTDALIAAAEALSAPAGADSFDTRLGTYEYLLNRYESGDEEGRPSGIADPSRASELLDWVLTFQSRDESAVSHAIDRWRTSKSPSWLVVALTLAKPDAASSGQLLTAANDIAPTSPAYPTVAFHRARLLLLTGNAHEARTVLDALLQSPHLSQSAVNLVKAARLATARTFEEYFADAVRSPVDAYNDEFKNPGASATFDRDVVDVLNQRFPLTLMARAARDSHLPTHVRRDVALATFARAIVLDRPDIARSLLPAVVQLEPSFATPLQTLRRATRQSFSDEGALLLIRSPGLRPFVPAGRSREPGDLATIDSLRDNWWCGFGGEGVVPYETQYWLRGTGDRVETPQRGLYANADAIVDPDYLTARDREAAELERRQLKQTDTAPNELGRRVVAWARAHPADPRVPESLYLVVRATRYGCTNDRTSAVSKDAFTLLHRRYPKSTWTAKTPFWY
jgi:hypothetical protein